MWRVCIANEYAGGKVCSASGMGKTSTIFLESLAHQKYQIYFDES